MVRKFIIYPLIATALVISTGRITGDAALRTSTACLMTAEAVSSTETETDSGAPDNLLAHTNDHYAFARDINLRRWDKPQVIIAVVGTDSKRSIEETRLLVEQASLLWNHQVSSVVQVVMDDRAYADIVIRFVPENVLPVRTVGKTSVTYRALSGTLCHGDIIVQQGMEKETCVQALAHELGHALGIQGHSDNGNDLMFAKAHLPAAVTARDARTLRIGYGSSLEASPVATPAPVGESAPSSLSIPPVPPMVWPPAPQNLLPSAPVSH